MAELKRRSTMVPFMKMEPGNFYVVRCDARVNIDVKGQQRDCYSFSLFGSGPNPIPNVDNVVSMLGATPIPVMVGSNKGLVDALEPEVVPTGEKKISPFGRMFLLSYGGRKELAGGNKFNQWEVQEIILTDAEKKNLENF